MPWYEGPTLMGLLDALEAPKRQIDLPLRIPIKDVYKISGIGTVVTGRVATGVLKQNMEILISPAGIKPEVKSIEMHHSKVTQA